MGFILNDMGRKILSLGDQLLIRIASTDELKQLEHLFEDSDRQPVSDIVYRLTWNDLIPYLSGDVVNNWIFNGKRDYQSVDITTVPKNYDSDSERVRQVLREAKRTEGHFGQGVTYFRIKQFNGQKIQVEPVTDFYPEVSAGKLINLYFAKKEEFASK